MPSSWIFVWAVAEREPHTETETNNKEPCSTELDRFLPIIIIVHRGSPGDYAGYFLPMGFNQKYVYSYIQRFEYSLCFSFSSPFFRRFQYLTWRLSENLTQYRQQTVVCIPQRRTLGSVGQFGRWAQWTASSSDSQLRIRSRAISATAKSTAGSSNVQDGLPSLPAIFQNCRTAKKYCLESTPEQQYFSLDLWHRTGLSHLNNNAFWLQSKGQSGRM